MKPRRYQLRSFGGMIVVRPDGVPFETATEAVLFSYGLLGRWRWEVIS
jgi:hypothetical protein